MNATTTADDPPAVTGDLETDRRLDRLARARGEDIHDVASELIEFGFEHHEEALDDGGIE